ncbi:MAG: peptidylprolyl isomerase [Acidobacteria bacterium]|nr:peptidylprolyl isomerase [Acidobacteriota bacterium]
MRTALIPLILLTLGTLSGAEVIIVEEIVAKVNGDVVTRTEYTSAIDETKLAVGASPELNDEQKKERIETAERETLRNLIDELLLFQKGTDLEYNIETQVLRQRDSVMKQYNLNTIEEFEAWAAERFDMPIEDLMDQMRRNVMSNTVLQQEVGPRIVIPQEEMEKYYQEHKATFIRKEGVQLSQIVILKGKEGETDEEAKTRAEQVRDRVHRGEPFAEMAKRFSDDKQTAERGGALGLYERGMLRKEFEDLVFNNNPGFITDLLDVPTGYLMLKVEQRFEEGQAEFADVEEDIRARLSGPLWTPAVRSFLSELRQEAYIEIRPGYVDVGAVAGMNTDWSDPAKLTPVITTKEELLRRKKNPKILWMIPVPGGGGDVEEPGGGIVLSR